MINSLDYTIGLVLVEPGENRCGVNGFFHDTVDIYFIYLFHKILIVDEKIELVPQYKILYLFKGVTGFFNYLF